MTSSPRAVPGRRKFSIALHRWHRRLGVAACLFLLWMAVSGWLLNHDDALGLARRQLHAPALLNWYGLRAAPPTRVFRAGDHWLAAGDNGLVLDGRLLAVQPVRPLGLVAVGPLLFVADAGGVTLLAADGAPVDQLRGALLPSAPVARIGSGCGGAVIEAGGAAFVTADGAGWQPCAGAVHWSAPQPISAAQQARAAALLAPGISAERLLLDLHSGRFAGAWGPYFVDAVGLAMALLALSGLWMFFHHRERRRR